MANRLTIFSIGFYGTALLLGQYAFSADPIKPIPLNDGANTAFADEAPDDRRGGWTDQGSNDVRLLKPGLQTIANIPFEILGDAETGGKSCIVLSNSPDRDYLPKQASLKLPAPGKGQRIYLLHAAAWGDAKNNLVGRMTVEYTTGKAQEFRIRLNRDVADWWSNRSTPNAARGWTVYNDNSQISLYVSSFPIDETREVAALHFDSSRADNGKSVWMIGAVSCGGVETVQPIKVIPVLGRDFAAPAVPDAAILADVPRTGTPKNIIFIIGDGMGQGAIRYAGLYAHGKSDSLVMNQLPVSGLASTYSANSEITDSAASGTALSSGRKTNNGRVGMKPDESPCRSIAEEARDSGRSVGIITTDSLAGATPAAFYAHVRSRSFTNDIAEFTVTCDFDILLGGTDDKPFRKRKDSRNLVEELGAKGYQRVENLEQFRKADKKVIGFLGGYNETDQLAKVSAEAFRRLSENPKGFFAMVEHSFPDSGGHGNNPNLSICGTLGADFVVKAALDFAAKNNDTLIVVTADHETGGLYCMPNKVNPRRPYVGYTGSDHTGAPVAVFAYGPGSDHFSGMIDNTAIPKAMAKLWNLTLNNSVK